MGGVREREELRMAPGFGPDDGTCSDGAAINKDGEDSVRCRFWMEDQGFSFQFGCLLDDPMEIPSRHLEIEVQSLRGRSRLGMYKWESSVYGWNLDRETERG